MTKVRVITKLFAKKYDMCSLHVFCGNFVLTHSQYVRYNTKHVTQVIKIVFDSEYSLLTYMENKL